MNSAQLLQNVQDNGFDQSYIDDHKVRVRCSQCQACCINGIACHETECPNSKKKSVDYEDDFGDDEDF